MLTPVRDKTGAVLLHDIWVAGKWAGSRSTVRQCIDALRAASWPSCVMAGDDFQINDDRINFDYDR